MSLTRTVIILVAVAGGLVWGYLIFYNITIAYELYNNGHLSYSGDGAFIVTPFVGFSASVGASLWLMHVGKAAIGLPVSIISLLLALFVGFIEAASRAG